jgi:hypothetical protein
MDSVWADLAHLGLSCTPLSFLVPSARLVKYTWESAVSVKANKEQCLLLIVHTKEVLQLVTEKVKGQNKAVIRQALTNLEG